MTTISITKCSETKNAKGLRSDIANREVDRQKDSTGRSPRKTMRLKPPSSFLNRADEERNKNIM